MGRPTKLTPETQDSIVEAIREGMYQEIAAATVGISTSTYYRWMERGQTGQPEDEPYREFREAIEKGRAEAERAKLKVISREAEKGNWTAAAWWLERSFPARWGRRIEHTVITRDILVEEIEKLERELALNDADSD